MKDLSQMDLENQVLDIILLLSQVVQWDTMGEVWGGVWKRRQCPNPKRFVPLI